MPTPADFIEANTRPLRPPLVPELRLHLADEAFGLWERTERQAGRTGLPLPFWAFAWAGGQALARHLLDDPGLVAGRTVLDLAAGSGLVAIAAAMAGANVTANEVDPMAAEAIAMNAALNNVTVAIHFGDLLGGESTARCAEVLLAGDVFYERPFAERVMPFLEHQQTQQTQILVGDPDRAYLPRHRFDALATYDVPVPRALEDADIKRTTVWQLRPASAAGPAVSPNGQP
jgi:predicted nicotinamide N-methyase